MSIEKIEPDAADEELLDNEFEFDSEVKLEKVTRPVTLAEKPIFSALLQRTAEQIWPNDAVVHDFVEFVATPLSENFAHVTAKGGDFVRQQLQAGKTEAEVERYKNDQSMRLLILSMAYFRYCISPSSCKRGMRRSFVTMTTRCAVFFWPVMFCTTTSNCRM